VLEAPFSPGRPEVTVGASIGVSVREALDQAHRDLADEDALLREADTAMYAAKRTGEGPVVVFEDTLRRRAVARLEDEQGLRRALQRDELRVHYQPIVRSDDLSLSGFEALVRWQHPERGLLGPAPSCRRRRRPAWSSPSGSTCCARPARPSRPGGGPAQRAACR
jgi:predicted signal transduction protein with EAL and GGDEF domain